MVKGMDGYEKVRKSLQSRKNPDPIQASNIFKKWGLVPGASGFQFFFLPWSFLVLVTDIAVEYNKKEVPVQQLMFEKSSFCILVNQYFQLFLLLDIQNE